MMSYQHLTGDTLQLCAAGRTEGVSSTNHAVLLSDSLGQQVCVSEFNSVPARQQRHSNNFRAHPYGRRLNGTASSWPEFHNCTTACNLNSIPRQRKVMFFFSFGSTISDFKEVFHVTYIRTNLEISISLVLAPDQRSGPKHGKLLVRDWRIHQPITTAW